MVKRRGGKNAFDRREKPGILRQRQAAHQYRAWVDFLMRRFYRKLGKEIHRLKVILSHKSEQKANYFTDNYASGDDSLVNMYPLGYN
jgi:hypothetical protein